MIPVLVREQDAVERAGLDPRLLEPAGDLPRAQAAVDEQPALRALDERAVPRAAAAEDGDRKHAPKVPSAGAMRK